MNINVETLVIIKQTRLSSRGQLSHSPHFFQGNRGKKKNKKGARHPVATVFFSGGTGKSLG
jgi:hypothetical protein